MNKLRTVFAVWITALAVAAFVAVPIRSSAQVNSYDDSFDAVAERHGYYRALMAATTNGADATAENGIDLARGAEADSARWVAFGKSYAKLAQADRQRGAAADAARWVAIGESYAKLAKANPERRVEADSARWVALGESYAKLAETDRERGAAADAARWVAIGESYAKLAEANRERGAAADAARWIAMAEYYTHLALQSEVTCQGDTC